MTCTKSQETTCFSKTNTFNSAQIMFETSTLLQQVVNGKSPDPFEKPPEMPQDLEQRFVASLQEYGYDLRMQGQSPHEMVKADCGLQKVGRATGKTVLGVISKERESPVKATYKEAGPGSAPVGLTINPPAWHSTYQAVADADNDVVGEQGMRIHPSSYERFDDEGHYDIPYDPDGGLSSSTTPASSHSSRPGSSCSSRQIFTRLDELTQHCLNLLRQQHLDTAHHSPGDRALDFDNVSQCASTHPLVLLQSPLIEKELSWDFIQKDDGTIAPRGFTSSSFAPTNASGAQLPLATPFLTDTQNPTVPRIAIQSPSPKIQMPKKRGADSQHEIGPPIAKIRVADGTVGLPVLPANQEAIWKFKFPGNTYSLLTIMIPWSLTMQRLYTYLQDPSLFSVNAAFPYRVDPPIARKLISVAFYDTSAARHREIRYIGPGDVATIDYSEVDIFSYSETDSTSDSETGSVFDSETSVVKRISSLQSTKDDSGQGRWAYIILKGHILLSHEVAPHVIIAWKLSAVTSSSECLHTIYPDRYIASKLAPQKPPSGLYDLEARYAASHSNLRSANAEQLAEGDVVLEPPDGALTLKKEVWKMEKAGRMPLIEGYRVDVGKWRAWMKAVGAGKGKVVVWRERD